MKVFVYGTLMRDRSNHQAFLSFAEYLGTGTITGYGLYDLGWYPGIVPKDNESVAGEVYQIDQAILKRLDELEDEGELYKRKWETIYMDNGQEIQAWVYVYLQVVREKDKVPFSSQPWRPRIHS